MEPARAPDSARSKVASEIPWESARSPDGNLRFDQKKKRPTRCRRPSQGLRPASAADGMRPFPVRVPRPPGPGCASQNTLPSAVVHLELVRQDFGLLKANLDNSDKYYDSPAAAAKYFMSRLQNTEIPTGSCLWEAFYLAHRHDKANAKFVGRINTPLKRRLRSIADEKMMRLWVDLIKATRSAEGMT